MHGHSIKQCLIPLSQFCEMLTINVVFHPLLLKYRTIPHHRLVVDVVLVCVDQFECVYVPSSVSVFGVIPFVSSIINSVCVRANLSVFLPLLM